MIILQIISVLLTGTWKMDRNDAFDALIAESSKSSSSEKEDRSNAKQKRTFGQGLYSLGCFM